MKKWIMILVCLMTMVVFTSCGTYSYYTITANYDICYPDGTQTRNDTAVVKVYTDDGIPDVYCYSAHGTNYVATKGVNFISTTAPVRLNNYEVKYGKKVNVTFYFDE